VSVADGLEPGLAARLGFLPDHALEVLSQTRSAAAVTPPGSRNRHPYPLIRGGVQVLIGLLLQKSRSEVSERVPAGAPARHSSVSSYLLLTPSEFA
jgi:hypothetical protein